MCEGIIRDTNTYIPRGFYTQAKQGDPISVMAIAQNPGRPMFIQKEGYKGLTPQQAAERHFRFVQMCFLGDQGKLFHNRLLDWLCDLLDEQPSTVFQKVVYTNLVKCSTPENKMPKRPVVAACYVQNLRAEIAYWNPTAIIGLGGRTWDALRSLGIPYHQMPHPSHREESDYHRPFLERVRTALNGSC
jgi:hypothetical protein